MDYGVAIVLRILFQTLKLLTRVRLAIFDLLMRLGPNLGPLAMVAGCIASLFVLQWGGSVLLRGGADDDFSVVLFFMWGLTLPFIRDGMEILRENRQRALTGLWPDGKDVNFPRWGEIGPSMTRINKLREWSKS